MNRRERDYAFYKKKHPVSELGNDEQLVRELFWATPQFSFCGDKMDTPLHLAVYQGHIDGATKLLAYGANPNNISSWMGQTPLHDAAACPCALYTTNPTVRPAMVRLLLENGANVMAVVENGATPLHLAVTHGHYETVQVLLDFMIHHGFGISPVTDNWHGKGTTPLMQAASKGLVDIVRLILSRGADLRMEVDNGDTAEDLARKFGHDEVAQILNQEKLRIDQSLAFAMGQHPRIGHGTHVRSIDEGVVKMVLEELRRMYTEGVSQ